MAFERHLKEGHVGWERGRDSPIFLPCHDPDRLQKPLEQTTLLRPGYADRTADNQRRATSQL